MHAIPRVALATAGFIAVLLPMQASTQDSLYPRLSPDAVLEGYGGCFGPRCFTYAAALDGDTALTVNTGPSISVTQRDSAGEWPLQQVLTNPDFVVPSTYPQIERALPFPPFGGPLALEGDTILASGTSKKYPGKYVVYVMKRSGEEWSKQQVLAIPARAEHPDVQVSDVAFDDGIAVISSEHTRSQAGYLASSWPRIDLFMRQSSGLLSRRAAIDPVGHAEQRYSSYRVEVSGRFILIGDPLAFNGAGRAYLYELTANGWSRRKTFAPTPGMDAKANFGHAIAIRGNRLAISAPEQKVAENQFGAIYVYDKAGSTWGLSQLMTAPEFFPYEGWPSEFPPEATDGWRFGYEFALDGDRIVATLHDHNWWTSPPLGYLFERRGTTWTAVATFDSPFGLPYPHATFLSGSRLVLGANDDAYAQAGYVFELPEIGTITPP